MWWFGGLGSTAHGPWTTAIGCDLVERTRCGAPTAIGCGLVGRTRCGAPPMPVRIFVSYDGRAASSRTPEPCSTGLNAASISAAALRPSSMAHTMSEAPRLASPATYTFGRDVR